MRSALVLTMLLLVSCTGSATPTTTSHGARPTPSPNASSSLNPLASPSPPPSPEPLSPDYGLLIADAKVEMINSRGEVAASAPIRPSSIVKCANGVSVAVQPPVSATLDRIYFRDGDTQIRFLTLAGQIQDVATVPGGSSVVSFFSISPDDKRILVESETVSGPTIAERLYVEDLIGGGNHVELYSTISADKTLWPMGWYQGNLLLALMPACASDVARLSPLEWHYSSASTGNRLATIKVTCAPEGHSAFLSRWPSPPGVMCEGAFGDLTIHNWAGATTAIFYGTGAGRDDFTHDELSPSGARYFNAYSSPPMGLEHVQFPSGAEDILIAGHEPCLWLGETHLLAGDAVIELTGNPPNIYPISVPGLCAGAYPNPL